ncbi:MAG: hypothetical protein HZB46_12250 [Solirubrobacterales bacterium]|nr:hypothetical protein [Solirubrobacterales bacterium]
MRPPLFRDHPLPVQLALGVALPVAFGLLTGYLLGVGEGWWIIANVIGIGGGLGAGFDHVGAAEGAKRGLVGGVLFGVGVVLGDALWVDAREATVVEPFGLFPLITATISSGLGALGGAMRARVEAADAAQA